MLEFFLACVALGFGLAAVGARNNFVRLREDVARCRAEAKSALVRRIDLVNRMIEVALRYEAYERDIIEMVTRATAQRPGAISPVVANLTVSYPQLRASEQYQELMRQVAAQEENARAALAAYNNAAALHNTATGQIPWNLLWSSPTIEYLDMSMEQDILPAYWDSQRLRFATGANEVSGPRRRIARD